MKPLYRATETAGLNNSDITEGTGTVVNLKDFTNLMNQYNVTADTNNESYLVQDDQHQYEVKFLSVSPKINQAIVAAQDNGFANKELEETNVLYQAKTRLNPESNVMSSLTEEALEQSDEEEIRRYETERILEP